MTYLNYTLIPVYCVPVYGVATGVFPKNKYLSMSQLKKKQFPFFVCISAPTQVDSHHHITHQPPAKEPSMHACKKMIPCKIPSFPNNFIFKEIGTRKNDALSKKNNSKKELKLAKKCKLVLSRKKVLMQKWKDKGNDESQKMSACTSTKFSACMHYITLTLLLLLPMPFFTGALEVEGTQSEWVSEWDRERRDEWVW